MFRKRNYSAEQMDDFKIQDERLESALIELKIINKFLGGFSTSFEGIKRLLNGVKPRQEITVLDAGSGASDILLNINRKLSKLKIFSIDANLGACRYISVNSSYIRIVCADMMNLPFNHRKFDVIHLSLVLHHFNENEIINLLKKLSVHVNIGIVINDLRRSVWAYLGIKILTSLFSNSNMVKNDAPLSVLRGFKKSEILKLLEELNFQNYLVKRKWAFRWLIIINFQN